ncbi:MAG TPA: VOC family protein [Solirubrobacter sp.]|nr:VOC family protein [Solirubrobacter sp.]
MIDTTAVSGVHAVMIGVRSIDEAAPRFLDLLGGELQAREYIEHSNFHRQLIRLPSGTHVQLMEPGDGEKPLNAFLERRGEGVFGIAFEADGLEAIEARLKEQDEVRVVGEIVDLPGMRELVLHPKDTHGVFTVYRELKREGVA